MTTLPQTTPIRLPRAGGQSQLAVQAPQSGVAAALPGYTVTVGDILRIIRSNIWLVIALVVVTGVGGFFLNGYLEKNYPVYKTHGILRITPPQSTDPLHPVSIYGDTASMSIEQLTDCQLLKSDDLFQRALEDEGKDNQIRKTDWFNKECGADVNVARRRLGTALSVTPEGPPNLIDVAMSAANPQDTVTVAEAVVAKAMERQKEFVATKNQIDINNIKQRKDKYKRDLDFCKDSISQLEIDLIKRGADPNGSLNTRDTIYAEMFKDQIIKNDRKNTANNTLASFDESIKAGVTPLQIETMLNDDRDLYTQKETIANINLRLQEFQGDAGSGPNDPRYKNMQDLLASSQARLDKDKIVKKADFTKSFRDQLLAGQVNSQQQYDESVKVVQAFQQENAELANKVDELIALRDEQALAQDFLNQYTKAEQDLNHIINQSDNGNLDWAAPPRQPDGRVSPNLSTTLAGSIAVGLFLSLGIAFLREVTDTTVRSPRDIARVGNLNLLGMISHEQDDPQSSGVRLPLVIFEAPQSIMAEQLRQVRTRLQHTASLDTTRTLLVTSPNPGDGKSTIAVNLAAGLALNGRRILLVDGNFRRPELHRIFGVGNDVGFSDVLNDVGAFATAVRETPVPNLSVMASGPKPSNPTELLESQLLLDFIERALEEYDHVIFDSGPMLFVSESVALAPRVDGVLTVVRARTSSRGVLTRMRDSLRAVKAEHLGVILNGVRTQAGGYYAKGIKTYYQYQNAD